MLKILPDLTDLKMLVTGDAHAGSSGAILPPKAEDFSGDRQPQNAIQRWVWKNWENDLNEIGKVDVLINMGDSIEGNQPEVDGRTLVSTDTDNQVRWATEIYQKAIEICKPTVMITIQGTPYHSRMSGGSSDFNVHKWLQKDNPNVEMIYSEKLEAKIGKMKYSLAHTYPTSEMLSPPGEKLLKEAGFEYYLGNGENFDVIGRAHAHRCKWENYRGKYIFVTPCQQVESEYAKTKAYLTIRKPDVGVLELTQMNDYLSGVPHLHRWRQ